MSIETNIPPVDSSAPPPSAFSSGSVIFSNGLNLAQNNAAFNWDSTNQYLKLGNSSTSQGAARWGTAGNPYVIHVSTTTFNGVDDYMWTIGYNVTEGTNTTRIDVSEPYWKIGMEHHYYDGADHWCEFNADFLSADGTKQRRPFNFAVNRTTGLMEVLFRGKYIYQEDSTGSVVLMLDNSGTPNSRINFGQQQPLQTTASQALFVTYGGSGANEAPIHSFFRNGFSECLLFVNSTGDMAFANTGGVADYNDATLNTATNWKIQISTGHWLPGANNTYNIGAPTTGLVKNIYWGTQLLGPSGSLAAPSMSFTANAAAGWYYSSNIGGAGTTNMGCTTHYLALGGSITFLSGTLDAGTGEATIIRDGAANITAIKNSTNAQTFRIYGTTTGTKYLTLSHNATNALIDASAGNITLGGTATQIIHPNGTLAAPGVSFSGSSGAGWYYSSNIGGTGTTNFGGTTMYVALGGSITFLSGTLDAGSGEATITRDGAANVTAIKNGNSAQTFRTYAGNGANLGIVTVNESLTIAAAATTDSSTTIPAGAVILSVAVRVTTVIPTAATFTVTAATGGNTFNTAAVSTAANSTDLGSAAGALYTSAGTKVRITPNLTPATGTGVVRLAIMYYLPTAPTS